MFNKKRKTKPNSIDFTSNNPEFKKRMKKQNRKQNLDVIGGIILLGTIIELPANVFYHFFSQDKTIVSGILSAIITIIFIYFCLRGYDSFMNDKKDKIIKDYVNERKRLIDIFKTDRAKGLIDIDNKDISRIEFDILLGNYPTELYKNEEDIPFWLL